MRRKDKEETRNTLSIQILGCFVLLSLGFLAYTMINGNSSENPLCKSQISVNWTEKATWHWLPTEVVSTESTDESSWPSLTVDPTDNIHIAWEDTTDYGGAGTDADIFYKRWNTTSSIWTPTEVVSTESTGDSLAPSLAVDSPGNVHIAWEDKTDYDGAAGTDYDIFYKRWNVSSGSWTATEVVSTESTAGSYYPHLAVDSPGNIHITWCDYTDYEGAGSDLDIFYKRWNATSSSWTPTEVVSTESTLFSGIPRLAVDSPGNVHITWDDRTDYNGAGTDRDIFYKRWNVSSGSWTPTEIVSTESTQFSSLPSLTVDSPGNVHIAWADHTDYDGAAGTDYDIFYKRWNATSSSWTPTEVVSTESTDESSWPSLTVDPTGNIHIAWEDITDYGGAGTDADIFYKRWNATSSSWTPMEVVSIESTNDSRWPSLAVDSPGNIHIAWDDYTKYEGTGTDPDIFYKAFWGFPESPTLDEIVPNPSTNGLVDLHWTEVSVANRYYIYRATTSITSVSELTPLATRCATTHYQDNFTTNGQYYYVIVAGNSRANSSISNCVAIEIAFPATTPTTTPPATNMTPGPTYLVVLLPISLVSLLMYQKRRN